MGNWRRQIAGLRRGEIEGRGLVREVTRGQELRPGRLQVREQQGETSSQYGVCDAFEDHVDLSGSGFVVLADPGYGVGEDFDERAIRFAGLVADRSGGGSSALGGESPDSGDGVVEAATLLLLDADSMDEA